MTIVSDETVSKALAYLSEDPHPLANAEKAVMFAEMEKDEVFANLYLATEGTAKERESAVLLDPAYKTARRAEIEAEFEKARHKRRTDAADRIIAAWQTQNANIRAAERVR
jgi:hypothetical protein